MTGKTVRLITGCMAFAVFLALTPLCALASMPVDPDSKEGREMLKEERIRKDPKLFEQMLIKKYREKHGLVGTPGASETGRQNRNNIEIKVHD